jgi:hypothetical protein
MTLGMVGLGIIAPSFTAAWLWLAALCVAAAWFTFMRAREGLLPPRPDAHDVAGALRADTPAVVNLLANDATVTAAGFRATMIDLAARGWLRILPPEDDLEELARVRPAATAYQGDALRPHERLVLQHVMSRFTTDRAIPARYLAVDIRGGWWRRFSGLVVDEAVQAGLIRRRWTPTDLLVPTAFWAGGFLFWLLARGTGDDSVAVIDSVGVRIAGWTLAACWWQGSSASPGWGCSRRTPTPTRAWRPLAAGSRYGPGLPRAASRIWRRAPWRRAIGASPMRLRCAWPKAPRSSCRSLARITTAPGAASGGGRDSFECATRRGSRTAWHRSSRSASAW